MYLEYNKKLMYNSLLAYCPNILNSILMDCEFDIPSILTDQSYSSFILILGDLRVTVCFSTWPWFSNKSLSSEYVALSSTS